MKETSTSKNIPGYIEVRQHIPYRWAAGEYVGRFLQELRDNEQIYANKCPACGRYLIPMRPWCGRCNVRMAGMYPVGPRGTVLAFEVVEQPSPDPGTGLSRQVPYATAIIQLDGAPVTMQHFLEETDHTKIFKGMRVEAVFKPREQRIAHLLDIKHFRTISD